MTEPNKNHQCVQSELVKALIDGNVADDDLFSALNALSTVAPDSDEESERMADFVKVFVDNLERAGIFPDNMERLGVGPANARTALLNIPKDKLHGFAVQALAQPQNWKQDAVNGYSHAFRHESTDSKGGKNSAIFGVRGVGSAPSMGELLALRGPIAVKAWYGLWARWFETGCRPSEPVILELNQFCDDLGYKRHHKGGHRLEAKEEAVQILDFITSIEMAVQYPHPNEAKRKKGVLFSIAGPIWLRSAIAREGYIDLFAANKDGETVRWEAVGFQYQPGHWHARPEYQEHYRDAGKTGAGLLQLANDKDQWAILIGGYLGWIGTANGYKPKKLRAERILEAVGLAQGENEKRCAGRSRDKFERALDRLRDVGVIEDWTWPDTDTTEPDDMDDVASLAAYAADTSMVWKGGEWRRKCVHITWSDTLAQIGERRQEKRAERVKTATANRERLIARNTAKQSEV